MSCDPCDPCDRELLVVTLYGWLSRCEMDLCHALLVTALYLVQVLNNRLARGGGGKGLQNKVVEAYRVLHCDIFNLGTGA